MKSGRIMSWILIFTCLLTFNFGQITYAESLSKEDEEAIEYKKETEFKEKLEPKIIGELKEKRSANTKHFIKEDGTIEVVTYDEDIHYQKDGLWVDINNDLDIVTEDGVKKSDKNIFQNIADKFSGKKESFVNKDNAVQYTLAKEATEEELGELKIDNAILKWTVPGILQARGKELYSERDIKKDEEIDVEEIAEEELKDKKYENLERKQKKEVKETKKLNEKAKNNKNNKRSVLYQEIKEDVDLKYVIKGTTLKEDIILKKYKEKFTFEFNLQVTGLEAKVEGKSIIFLQTNTKKELFRMLAPNMIDSKGEYSEKIDVKLDKSEKGYKLTIIPDNDWLKDGKRVYPVTIDPPIVSTSLAAKDIRETFVAQNDPDDKYLNQYIRVGVLKDNMGVARSFVKFQNLPQLTAADIIVDAKLYLLKDKTQSVDGFGKVDVHKVTKDWQEKGMKWSTQPTYDPRVVDSHRENSGDWNEWNITSIVKEWYSTGQNYGLMIKRSNETVANTCYWASDVSDIYSYARPQAVIQYRNFGGIEDYWSFHSQDIGRAGSVSVNDYTGNLITTHPNFNSTGNRMPVTLSHVYNTSYVALTKDFGYGWKLDALQTVFWDGEDSQKYKYAKYMDRDGTVHFFKTDKPSGTVYKDMDGLDLTLTVVNNELVITDKKDGKLIFDTRGYIIREEDSNGNKITYGYDGYTINKITDGVGRTYTLTYKTEAGIKLLDKLREDATGDELVYSYQNGQLTAITYPDKNTDGTAIKTQYFYNANRRLERIVNYDGYEIKVGYYNEEPRRVQSISEFANSIAGGSLKFEYGYNKTKVIDDKGIDNIIHFNDWGNPIVIQDEEGRASIQKFIGDGNNKNKLSLESKLQLVSNNVIKNHNGELNSAWVEAKVNGGVGSATYTTEEKFGGNQSLKVNSTSEIGEIYYTQDVNVLPGKSYTLSAYVRSSDITGSGNIQLSASYGDGAGGTKVSSATVESNAQWKRYDITMDIPTNSPKTVKVLLGLKNIKGTANFDCIQLEEGNSATRYNYIENSDLDYAEGTAPLYWSKPIAMESSDSVKVVDSKTTFTMNGSRALEKILQQEIKVNGQKGDNLVIGGWAKAATIEPDDTLKRKFSMFVEIVGTDNTKKQTKEIKFNNDYHDWQYMSDVIIPEYDYKAVIVHFRYWNNANIASLDNMQVYKEEFGTSYVYDEKGNPISVTAADKKKGSNEFNAKNDLIRSVNPKGNDYKYEYDNKHNITKATSSENIVSTFKYDQYGNPTNTTLESDTMAIENSATYTADGNYTKDVTDEMGSKVTYNRDLKSGLLNSTVDPNGKTINYKYDSNDRMTEASKNVGDKVYKANYEYTKDKLTKITNNGVTSEISYDDFGNQKQVKVANSILVTNNYEAGNGNLSSVLYGNGDKITYEYNKYQYLTKKNFYDGVNLIGNVQYHYDKEGALIEKVDSLSDLSFKYKYDMIGRLASVEGSDNITTNFAYDTNNNVSSVMESYGNEASTLISKGRITKASSQEPNTAFVANFVNDGRSTTRWSSEFKEGQWIQIDLGSVQNINKVVFNWEAAYAKKYDIQISNNEIDWFNIYSEEYGTGKIEEIKGLNSNARYIRVISRERARSGMSLFEFEVYDNNLIGTTYNYDKDDRPISLNTTSGLKINYSYDSIGRVTDKNHYLNGGKEFKTSVMYEDRGKGVVSGKEKTLTSDVIKSIKNGDKQIDYTHDKGGNIETITEAGKTIKYYYDDIGQLIREDNQQENVTKTYTYDGGSNILEKKVYPYTTGELTNVTSTKGDKYGYDVTWKDKLIDYNGVVIQYDEIGNPIKIGEDVLNWTRGRKLESYTKGNTKISYKYNEDGIRTEKNNNGIISKYHLIGDKVTYEEINNNGQIEKLYYKYDTVDNLVSMEYNGIEYLYIRNIQDDVIGLVDGTTGNMVVSYKYDSWGKLINIEDTSTAGIGERNPYRYRGYRYDSETGLYYLNSRYYNPEWGRFINGDAIAGKIGNITSHNLYAYCQNSPINFSDPSGYFFNRIKNFFKRLNTNRKKNIEKRDTFTKAVNRLKYKLATSFVKSFEVEVRGGGGIGHGTSVRLGKVRVGYQVIGYVAKTIKIANKNKGKIDFGDAVKLSGGGGISKIANIIFESTTFAQQEFATGKRIGVDTENKYGVEFLGSSYGNLESKGVFDGDLKFGVSSEFAVGVYAGVEVNFNVSEFIKLFKE